MLLCVKKVTEVLRYDNIFMDFLHLDLDMIIRKHYSKGNMILLLRGNRGNAEK